MAMPTPARTPTADANSPTTSASPTTEAITWRRLAPRVRNSASSRVRCATMIENVLKMRNAPTNSEIAANTSNAVWKNPRPSCSASACSSATAVLVRTSAPVGRTARTSASSERTSTPSSPRTLIVSTTPSFPSTRWAVARSKSASVAPPRLSAEPNPAIPTTRNVSGGPWKRIVSSSPTAIVFADAVPASITTSPSAAGGPPSRISRTPPASSDQLVPIVGGPTPPITSSVSGFDHLGVAGHVARGDGDPRDGRDLGHQRLVERLALVASSSARPRRLARERVLGANDQVGSLRGLIEELVERGVHRVGEDVGAGDEAHADHDRQRGQEQAELLGQDALDRGTQHRRQPSSDFRWSSTRSVVGATISSTTSPSARKTTRSA